MRRFKVPGRERLCRHRVYDCSDQGLPEGNSVTRRRWYAGLPAVAVLGLGLGGCGSVDERRADATAAGTAFERAVAAGDVSAMCAGLAPRTRGELEESGKSACADAIATEELPPGGTVRTVDVYGRQARIVLTSETLFLSQFADGWKVVAAGCRPEAGRPYQCSVKGGDAICAPCSRSAWWSWWEALSTSPRWG